MGGHRDTSGDNNTIFSVVIYGGHCLPSLAPVPNLWTSLVVIF